MSSQMRTARGKICLLGYWQSSRSEEAITPRTLQAKADTRSLLTVRKFPPSKTAAQANVDQILLPPALPLFLVKTAACHSAHIIIASNEMAKRLGNP